jgi:hypothetical protein
VNGEAVLWEGATDQGRHLGIHYTLRVTQGLAEPWLDASAGAATARAHHHRCKASGAGAESAGLECFEKHRGQRWRALRCGAVRRSGAMRGRGQQTGGQQTGGQHSVQHASVAALLRHFTARCCPLPRPAWSSRGRAADGQLAPRAPIVPAAATPAGGERLDEWPPVLSRLLLALVAPRCLCQSVPQRRSTNCDHERSAHRAPTGHLSRASSKDRLHLHVWCCSADSGATSSMVAVPACVRPSAAVSTTSTAAATATATTPTPTPTTTATTTTPRCHCSRTNAATAPMLMLRDALPSVPCRGTSALGLPPAPSPLPIFPSHGMRHSCLSIRRRFACRPSSAAAQVPGRRTTWRRADCPWYRHRR